MASSQQYVAKRRFIRILLAVLCFGDSKDVFISCEKPPHILFVLVDDLGWGDVGFHESEIKTPNIDRLAAEGVQLENYYVQPVCSPTRTSLMSGRYPIHTGFQNGGLAISSPFGLPLNFTTFPEKLKEAGYSTHMVGKWHLGFYKWEYTPTYRGFDTFYGYYNGAEDHYTHEKYDILDLRDNKEPARDMNGTYSIHMFMKQVQKIVSKHDPSKPLFLYLAFQNVHAPVQAPQSYINKYHFIKDKTRRVYAAMADIMDEAVGNVTQLFRVNRLWEDTLMVLSADNGGRPLHGGYNWPLRGQKKTLWEGGVRAVGFVHSNRLEKPGVRCHELIHVTDWYPTLLSLAGVKHSHSYTPPLDGFNVWDSISRGQRSPRKEILHNIDLKPRKKVFDRQGVAIRVGHMKLLMNVSNQTWFVPPEQEGLFSSRINEDASDQENNSVIKLALYNITADPEERNDLSKRFPDIVSKLQDRVEFYKRTMVPSLDGPHDPNAMKVAQKNKIWSPWRD